MKTSGELREIRKRRQRYKISRTSCGRCRLLVHRTNNNIYAQILDVSGKSTVAHVSTLSKAVKEVVKNGGNKEAAACVGKLIAKAALDKGIKEVVFDRSGFLYHGRVQLLAESARENGLVF